MPLADIPWIAVVVGAVLAFALGALWYSRLLFAKPWMALAHPGKTEEDLRKNASPAPYALAALAWLVAAATLGWFAMATGLAGDLLGSLRIGLYAGIGVVLPILALNSAFSGKSYVLLAIDAGYAVTGLAIVGLILGLLG